MSHRPLGEPSVLTATKPMALDGESGFGHDYGNPSVNARITTHPSGHRMVQVGLAADDVSHYMCIKAEHDPIRCVYWHPPGSNGPFMPFSRATYEWLQGQGDMIYRLYACWVTGKNAVDAARELIQLTYGYQVVVDFRKFDGVFYEGMTGFPIALDTDAAGLRLHEMLTGEKPKWFDTAKFLQVAHERGIIPTVPVNENPHDPVSDARYILATLRAEQAVATHLVETGENYLEIERMVNAEPPIEGAAECVLPFEANIDEVAYMKAKAKADLVLHVGRDSNGGPLPGKTTVEVEARSN